MPKSRELPGPQNHHLSLEMAREGQGCLQPSTLSNPTSALLTNVVPSLCEVPVQVFQQGLNLLIHLA
jgi:hypothetical protein